jgi:hypothetical protein
VWSWVMCSSSAARSAQSSMLRMRSSSSTSAANEYARLLSAAHQEVQRRGDRYARELGDGFAGVVLRAADAITHPDAEAAVRSCFSTVFAATMIRVAYGAAFAAAVPLDDDAFVSHLGEMAVRYLLGEAPD